MSRRNEKLSHTRTSEEVEKWARKQAIRAEKETTGIHKKSSKRYWLEIEKREK
ncbi:MAG: hypothetical protein PHG22_01775 [Patescibacteria group bacterium]|nr:hypothetical protein [Patescibacteria group bacterium]